LETSISERKRENEDLLVVLEVFRDSVSPAIVMMKLLS
jgi:hypothetical protein